MIRLRDSEPMNRINFHLQSPFSSLLPFPSPSDSSHLSLSHPPPSSLPSSLPLFLSLPSFPFLGPYPRSQLGALGSAVSFIAAADSARPPNGFSYSKVEISLWWVVTAVLKRFTDYTLYKSQSRSKSWSVRTPTTPTVAAPLLRRACFKVIRNASHRRLIRVE